MASLSLEELKKLIRRIEFNRTEHELLIELVKKASTLGENERRRLKLMRDKAAILFKQLNTLNFFNIIYKIDEKIKEKPLAAIDGSFQVTGGIGGLWYGIIGVAEVIASEGFTLEPKIKVGGIIEQYDAIDEAEAKRKARRIMMLAEMKAMRDLIKEFRGKKASYLIIDGPIIDPPLLIDERYITERANVIRDCIQNNITVIGFVKRIMGKMFLRKLDKITNGKFSNLLKNYSCDLDLMGNILNNALVKFNFTPVYTTPLCGCESEGISTRQDQIDKVYQSYEKKGIKVYYSYYKPRLQDKVYRIELASLKELNNSQLTNIFKEIFNLIFTWTLPGMGQPLPILIAHRKCNVRKGAADTLYYEIITKAFSQDNINQYWLL